MIEIFEDRMEIMNPGVPLVDTQRFLDNPPRSRNETLASLMRRVGICEERGSGVDAAAAVGKSIAEKAKEVGVTNAVFDRGGFLYHGRVKALADAAREAGLEF